MSTDLLLELLGGLAPQTFMRRYWQREPLLIRQAIPGFRPPLSIADIRQLVRREEVESRLIWHDAGGWNMKSGPFSRLPAAKRKNWTLLAQSVDLHDDAIAALMHRFRFISDARLDDAMISIAGDGGGVGPHFDSYDVFLLQAVGRRRWRISRQRDLSLEPGLPLKILKNFHAEREYVLEAGDMLYLPPQVAHDGVAIGDCMTISVGFRAPSLATLARGMLEAAGDQLMARHGDFGGLYGNPPLPGPALAGIVRDAGTPATTTPARLPDTLISAALDAVGRIRFDPALAARFLGQWLTDLSPNAYFDPAEEPLDLSAGAPAAGWLTLDRCTRLAYRDRQLFINGEVAPVPAKKAFRELADTRRLRCSRALSGALDADDLRVLTDWLREGWLHYRPGPAPG